MPKRLWEFIGMDWIVKLPKSKELVTNVEYDLILVIVCRLTKYAYFLLYKEASTATDLSY